MTHQLKSLLLPLTLICACGSDSEKKKDSGPSPASDGAPRPDSAPIKPPASGREICEAYIQCFSRTTPEGLGVIVATYGEGGLCWTSSSEETCAVACLTGLQNTQRVFSDEEACPVCFEDAHCESAGSPACDRGAGRCRECSRDEHCGGRDPACGPQQQCVECTRNEHCNGGVCNASQNRCAACVTNQDCPTDRPFCEAFGSERRCVECRSDPDCGSGSCTDNTCCQPESCGELKAIIFGPGSSAWICGANRSYRCDSYIDCGTCDQGTCQEVSYGVRRCSLEDTPCTPGSGTCAGGETCTYVPNKSDYICAADIRGSTCVYGGSSQTCNDHRFSCDGANMVNDGVCRAYCLKASDCKSTEKCSVYYDLGYGVCYPK